jgi:hypothetical protein
MLIEENDPVEQIRKTDQTYNITVTDEDGGVQDITGWEIFFTIKKSPDNDQEDTTALVTKKITNHSDPTAGKSEFTVNSSDSNLPPRRYSADLQFIFGGETRKVRYFDYRIIPAVTLRTE